MPRLIDILHHYNQSRSFELGGGPKQAVEPTPERKKLRADLEAVQRRNRNYFMISIVMLIVLFIVSLFVLVFDYQRPEAIKGLAGAIGISAAGLVVWMVRLWRGKAAVESLLVMVAYGDDKALQILINWWEQKLRSFP